MVGIKDFDIPSCCDECQMASCKGLSGQFYCDITTYDVDMDDTERDANCPLVEAISKDQYEERLKADIADKSVDEGYLYDWYISSVTDDEPKWTEAHLKELVNDFYLIPKQESKNATY